MGSVFSKRLMILGLCLGLASVLVHSRLDRPVAVKPQRLSEAFFCVGPWIMDKDIGFEAQVIEALHLDDYIHRTYINGSGKVWVYVGYDLAGDNIGDSHSPLVCYPGQGWQISDKRKVALNPGGQRLLAMSMVVTRKGREEFVLYWFQADGRNAPDTFHQKMQAMWARLTTGRADSAFIRISAVVGEGGRDEARRVAIAFAEAFYPPFHDYVTGEATHTPGESPGEILG